MGAKLYVSPVSAAAVRRRIPYVRALNDRSDLYLQYLVAKQREVAAAQGAHRG